MSLLNLNLSIVAYLDGPSSTQPRLRQADLSYSLMGIPTDGFKQVPLSLAPGETQVVTSLGRTISYSPSTTFTVTSKNGVMRLAGSIGQRTSKNAGNTTTQWTTTVNGSAVRMQFVGGTSPVFSNIIPGDFVNIDSGTFNALNVGEFLILSVGSSYIEFMNPYAQPETAATGSLSVYSSGPVQKGDIVDIIAPQFAFPNQGTFSVVKVTDQYIEMANPNTFPQSVTNVSSGITIYPFAYQWMAVIVDHKALIGLNGDTPLNVQVEPPVEGDLVKNPGIFLKRGKVTQVQITNPTQAQLSGFLILAE